MMLDLTSVHLLQALVMADEREAARLVFLGWPGQNEVDVTPEVSASSRGGPLRSAEGLSDFDLQGDFMVE